MLLSICIPTHDGRAGSLAGVLDTLAPQVVEDARVELCVSDNASCDGTRQVVSEIAERLGDQVRYQRHPTNRGFTGNITSVVELARGRWCWFVGSDDLVSDTAVAELVAFLERHPDSAGATLYRTQVHVDAADPSSGVHHDPPTLLPDDHEREQEFDGEDAIVRNLAQLQDFISTQIVDRELWLEVVGDLGDAGLQRARAYPHLLVIGRMVRRRPRWAWYPRDVVRQRVGVTSLYDGEKGYDQAAYDLQILRDRAEIWAELHGRGSPLYRAALTTVWHRHFNLQALLHIKFQRRGGRFSVVRLTRELLGRFWWMPRFWALGVPVLVAPTPVLRGAGRVLRMMR